MELPARIQRWADWPGWRRHAPAAGSVVVHGVVGLAIAGLMTAAGKPLPPIVDPEPPVLQVELVTDTQPLPEVRPPPGRPPPRAPAPKSGPVTDVAPPPVATPRKDEKKDVATAPDSDSVYIPRSPFAQPAQKGGLEGLASNDPCAVRIGVKPKDCGTDWAARVGAMDSVMPRSKAEMRQQFAAFMPDCKWKVGCEPTNGVLNNGARSFGDKSPMASGPGGVQGINELVGRLPQKPDFVDPGFGD